MKGTCFECKFMRNRTDLEPCEYCTNTFAMTGVHPSFTLKKPPITHYDSLRAMSMEELAKHLCCPWKECKNMNLECDKCLLDWLRKEAPHDKQ